MLTPLLLFLHILTMFTAVAVGYGSGLVLRVAYMTGQVGPVRGVGIAMARIGPMVPILFVAGGIFGLLTAISFDQDLLVPWLVIAYLLFATNMVIGELHNRRWGMRLGALLAQTPDGPITPELAAMFTEPRVVIATLVEYAVLVLIVFDMVVKPFS